VRAGVVEGFYAGLSIGVYALRALISTACADELRKVECSRVRRWSDLPARTLALF
jgi:hypothetical protein